LTAKQRKEAVRRAATQLGVTEYPANSNDGREIRKYRESIGRGLPPAPWCMYFIHWVFSPWIQLGGWASVQAFELWAADNGKIVQRPFSGDIVCYDWNHDRWHDHVGVVERVLALRWRGRVFSGWVRTIEGNTSVGNDSNGGMVMRRWRWINTAKFVRV
jgi:hypothetical protein